MAYTQKFLGGKAGMKLLAMGQFDMTTFTLTNGVHCEVKPQKCMVSKLSDKVDADHTKALFGK